MAKQTEPGFIVCARYGGIFAILCRCRDVEELLEECGLHVDHTTVWRWVQDYGPELLEQRNCDSISSRPTSPWRVDETYVRVKGRWCYLYRAIDSKGATIDFLLSAFRDSTRPSSCFARRSAIDPILNLE